MMKKPKISNLEELLCFPGWKLDEDLSFLIHVLRLVHQYNLH